MFRIDPTRLDLAREFKQSPYGVHSADLQSVLNLMRSQPLEGKHVLVMTEPQRQWTLARMIGEPPMPELLDNHVFESPDEAEWFVFKLRWEALTGEMLAID